MIAVDVSSLTYANITFAFVVPIIAAKWAMDLGYNQARQAIWFLAALLVPPVALLVLYSRLHRQRVDAGRMVPALAG